MFFTGIQNAFPELAVFSNKSIHRNKLLDHVTLMLSD
jgi:hypothetical protein